MITVVFKIQITKEDNLSKVTKLYVVNNEENFSWKMNITSQNI